MDTSPLASVFESDRVLTVKSTLPGKPVRVLAFNGYSHSRNRLISLVIPCLLPGFEWVLPELPGHGDGDTRLTLQTGAQLIEESVLRWKPGVICGFSLGARLALSRPDLPCVAISPPFSSTFDPSDREEVLTCLNPRRVRESGPMMGLTEILEGIPIARDRSAPALVLYGQKDLRSVRQGIASIQDVPKISLQRIDRSGHADICDAPELITSVRRFLKERACQ